MRTLLSSLLYVQYLLSNNDPITLVRRTENRLSFSYSWWYSKLSAFSIQKKQKSHSLPFSTHFSLSNPSTTTQRLLFIIVIATHDIGFKACLKGSCHQRRRAGRTCQTCLVKTLRIKPQVCLWCEGQRTRVETRTVGHVPTVLSPLEQGCLLTAAKLALSVP